MEQVRNIVNQPVTPVVRQAGMSAGRFPAWFHDGVETPDFDNIDVRQTQELPYARFVYVRSDLDPGVYFSGQDLEFNSQLKYFYIDYSLPKKKLTEPEMLEINRLYRIIGHCEGQVAELQAPMDSQKLPKGF